MSRPPLGYETPRPRRHGAGAYWAAFAAGAVVGLFLASVIGDLIYHSRTGHHPDGGVTIISAIGIPIAAIIAGVVREVRKPKQTKAEFALCCGIAAAPLVFVILYAWF